MNHLLLLLGAVLIMFGTTACNKGDNPPANQCSSGQVYSASLGCLQTAGCPSGYGVYNGQCVSTNTSLLGLNGMNSSYANPGYSGTFGGGDMSSTMALMQCQGSCPAGYTQTQYGCLPQYGACQHACFGYYQGYCLGGAPTGYTAFPVGH